MLSHATLTLKQNNPTMLEQNMIHSVAIKRIYMYQNTRKPHLAEASSSLFTAHPLRCQQKIKAVNLKWIYRPFTAIYKVVVFASSL